MVVLLTEVGSWEGDVHLGVQKILKQSRKPIRQLAGPKLKRKDSIGNRDLLFAK